tara:strand:- start:161 stop:562 length:402 start_codon:yes stop_codon:yes gene_type:complete
MNYEKAARFLTVFGIVYVISLSFMTTLFSDFTYDLFDIYPGAEVGEMNIVFYSNVIYIFVGILGFSFLATNDMKYIDFLILFGYTLMGARLFSFALHGMIITPYILLIASEFILPISFVYLRKKINQSNLDNS